MSTEEIQPEVRVIVPGTVDEQPDEAISVIQGCADAVQELELDHSEKYRVRNKEMIDQADKVIAFWNGESTGTEHMIDTAKDKEVPVHVEPIGPAAEAVAVEGFTPGSEL